MKLRRNRERKIADSSQRNRKDGKKRTRKMEATALFTLLFYLCNTAARILQLGKHIACLVNTVGFMTKTRVTMSFYFDVQCYF